MKFKMNGRNWAIKELNQKEIRNEISKRGGTTPEDLMYFGITFYDNNVIFLDANLCPDRKRATLIHELTHCYINEFTGHADRSFREEDVCDIVANSFDIVKGIVEKYFKDGR